MFALDDDAAFPTAEMALEDDGFQKLARRDVTPEYKGVNTHTYGIGGKWNDRPSKFVWR